jgi:hypothetical protein
MNEQEFLDQQLALERRHLSEVKNALEAAIAAHFDEHTLDRFCQTCGGYLVFVLERFNAQEQKHVDLLRPRVTVDEGTFDQLLADYSLALEASREAVGRLRSALEARIGGKVPAAELIAQSKQYIDFYNETLRKRAPLTAALFARHYKLADWRASSFITADSILEERTRYAAVHAGLPSGIELKASGAGVSG